MQLLENSKKTLVTISHQLYDKSFVTATDGNVSMRISENEILTTPTSICKGWITEDDLVIVNMNGELLHGTRKVSTEIQMHLFIYKHRHDIHAVVHAHPPYATGFAVAGKALVECVLPEVVVGIGPIPLAKYATPSTNEVCESLIPFIKDHSVILMQNHGVVAMGKDLWDAYFKIEKTEHAAKIIAIARMLGGERVLTEAEYEKLKAISFESYGIDLSNRPIRERREEN